MLIMKIMEYMASILKMACGEMSEMVPTLGIPTNQLLFVIDLPYLPFNYCYKGWAANELATNSVLFI